MYESTLWRKYYILILSLRRKIIVGFSYFVSMETKWKKKHWIYVWGYVGALSRNHCCRGKTISITYSECVFVALFNQHEKCIPVLYCHLWPVWLYRILPNYLIKRQNFRSKILEHKKCILILSTNLSEIVFILRRIKLYITINTRRSSRKVTVFFVRF